MNDRLHQGLRAWLLGVAVNGGLAVVKLGAGIVGNSSALVADAVESLGDIISSLLVWGGLVIGSRPADDDHPYGHGKAEPLAALAVATTLILASGGIAWQAIREMRTPHAPPAPFTLGVLIAVVIAKETMFRYAARVGRQIDSSTVVLDAWHHRSDAITSAAAAIGISVALLGGPRWVTADEWAALVACLFIAFNGLRFARGAVHELMDATPLMSPVPAIQQAAMDVQGVRFVEKTIVRKMGADLYVDLHVEVDATMSVRDAHAIAHAVKDRIVFRCPSIADVLVHIEPHDPAMRHPAHRPPDLGPATDNSSPS